VTALAILGRAAAAFAVVALFVGGWIWSILVLQTFGKWSGGYCEDVGFCFEAKPLELTIQAAIAFVGVAVGTAIQIRCIRYVRGGDPPGVRAALLTLGVVVCVAAWMLYTEAAGVNTWDTS
jgi:hypothetical protein